MLSSTATRRRMSGGSRPCPCLRSTSSVSLDALGLEQGVGHYLDLWSAVLGLTLFPVGYLFHALTKRQA